MTCRCFQQRQHWPLREHPHPPPLAGAQGKRGELQLLGIRAGDAALSWVWSVECRRADIFPKKSVAKSPEPILQVKLEFSLPSTCRSNLLPSLRARNDGCGSSSPKVSSPRGRQAEGVPCPRNPSSMPTSYFSSPPNSEKSAMVVNSRNSSESKARRFFLTASSSAITITSTKN
jgi:hypothetical protein